MKTISTSQLRSQTRSLVRALTGGKSVALTYRGHRLAQIQPVKSQNGVKSNDPLYRLHHVADKSAGGLTDREMDRIVYGA